MTTNRKQWTAADIPSQAGRRAVVTGANSGIGFHTALELARHGAEVILPARNQAKAEGAIARIRQAVPSAQLVPQILDLASLASIHEFVERMSQRFPGPSLDLLINNAGVMAVAHREVSGDGFERQFATNYLGPFALTALLFPSIKAQPGSRIVTVASIVANSGKIEFDNLQAERAYKPMAAYSQSKLADLMFTLELQSRLTAAKSPVISAGSHPGYAVTNLQANHFPFSMKLLSAVIKPLAQEAAGGALPTLRAAVDSTVRTVANRLWSESERLTRVNFSFLG